MQKNTKGFITALAISFLDNFGISIVFILFAPLILDPSYGFFSSGVSVGAKNILLGVAVGIFPLALFLSTPLWGDIGDRWGRRRALLFTILGTVFGHLITALAIVFKSYLFLLGARAVAGFFAGNVSIALAVITDISTNEKLRARNFGLLTVALGVGWVSAMLLGGFLSDPANSPYFSPALPFYVIAALTFCGFLLVKYYMEETHRQNTERHFDLLKSVHEIVSALKIQQLRPILYVLFFWSMGWYFDFQWFTPISLELYKVTQDVVSLHLLMLGICWITGGVLINSFLVKRFSSHFLALWTVCLIALFMLFSSLSSGYGAFAFWFWATALVAPISLSNLFNMVSLSAPAKVQGKAMGFAQSFQALAGFVVPFIGGGLANLSIAFILPFSVALLLFAFLLLLRKRMQA